MPYYEDDDYNFIANLESLPVYLTAIKSGRTQFVKGVTNLHKQLKSLKGFKGRTELYSSEVFDYYDPFQEIQETVIASYVAPGLIRGAYFSMSTEQAKQKSELSNMIRTPMRFLEELHHQTYDQEIKDEDCEWMAADEIDFEPLSSLVKKGTE